MSYTPEDLAQMLKANPDLKVQGQEMQASNLCGPTTYATEADFQNAVIKFAREHGWEWIYHTHDSRRSEPGMLDLVMLRTAKGNRLRKQVAQIEFCKQNCNRLYSACPHPTKANCGPLFRQEEKQNGWPFILADEILALLGIADSPVEAVVLELKMPGKKPTKAQLKVIDLWSRVPGVKWAACVYPADIEEIKEMLK